MPPIGPSGDGALAAVRRTWRSLADSVGEETAWDELLSRFDRKELVVLAAAEFADLRGESADFAIDLAARLGDDGLLGRLARSLEESPGPPLDRAWSALEVLEGTGLIERSEGLIQLRDDLIEAVDGDDATIEALIEHLDEQPDEVWVALQGFSAIEPEIQVELISDLGDVAPLSPGLAEFLRLLAHSGPPEVRTAAVDALARWPSSRDEDPDRDRAWSDLAANHGDPDVVERARRVLGVRGDAGEIATSRPSQPQVVSGLVTAMDGEGLAYVALLVRDPGRGVWTAASFACDAMTGVLEAAGQAGPGLEAADALLDEFRSSTERDVADEVPALASGLLGGSLLLVPLAEPVVRFWLERVLGPGFRPRPFAGLEGGPSRDPSLVPFEEMPRRAAMVLDACPDWIDRSDRAMDLARELLLRHGPVAPQPSRDAGAYRFFYEKRLIDRLELYRRMLGWMGWFWHAAGSSELADSAFALAWQLGDPQHAVPSHPFAVELTTRSLIAAQRSLLAGGDDRPGKSASTNR